MPKLWTETIEAHRREVHDAILATAASLVAKHGLRGVTMSQIAEDTGIGRATLYKYFSDVEAVLRAWHERHLKGHLEQLAAIGAQAGEPDERLSAVLEAYGLISHEQPASELATALHRGEHVARAQQRLTRFLRELIAQGVAAGLFRDDVPAEELAAYCLRALAAAADLSSKAAVRRLVNVVMSGLRPQ